VQRCGVSFFLWITLNDFLKGLEFVDVEFLIAVTGGCIQ
jgi:hypothetical protein